MNDTFTDLIASTPFHVKHWPRAIVHPVEHDGGERLSLSWDLRDIDDKEKTRAIKEWCLVLPDLKQIRWLSVWSRVAPPLFEALCQMPNLECLQIKMSSVIDIGAIANLKQLRYLHIGNSTKVQSIAPLAALSQLRRLELENFKLVSDFAALLALETLESLTVTGSMWTKQTAESLDPAMMIKRSGDRLPPPEVAPVERDGIRYSQATDGRSVGADQVGGVLVATDIASGKQLWTLAVYGNSVNPEREADTQWRFFTSMAFDPDGRLRIVNEADKTYVVDVKARTTSPAG